MSISPVRPALTRSRWGRLPASLVVAGLSLGGLWSCAEPPAEPAAQEQTADEQAADAGTASETQGFGFTLPLPDGWRSESFPFPLAFAPDLPHRGVEEIRFAPGWSDAEAEDFWSYVFVWWIEPAGTVAVATLEEQLESYFRGLAAGAEVDQAVVQEEVDARLEATDEGYRGTVRIVDTFATQAPLDLFMDASRVSCPAAERELWIFSWSPQDRDHPIWQELHAIRDATAC